MIFAESASRQQQWSVRLGWTILGSCLEADEKRLLREMAAASGSRVVSEWDNGVTHVVCHLDEHGAAKCVAPSCS